MTDLAKMTNNPMWDAITGSVQLGEYPWNDGLQVGGLGVHEQLGRRKELTARYAWTITAPETVAFVAKHIGKAAVDPMAGSGYWAFLLRQVGVDVVASDLHPPGSVANMWHKSGVMHAPVKAMDAVDAVKIYEAGMDRVLLLAWPPYEHPIGAQVVEAFPGDRIVYLGEDRGGCCGDDAMFDVFDRDWRVVAEHRPVQWWGIHDYVTVYDRKVS